MKHSQALKHLTNLMIMLQKFRSNAAYELGDTPEWKKVLAMVGPWTFDDSYNLIPTLARVVGNAENGIDIEPISFYNVMTIAHRLEPMIAAMAACYESPLPAPDMRLVVTGWESET